MIDPLYCHLARPLYFIIEAHESQKDKRGSNGKL